MTQETKAKEQTAFIYVVYGPDAQWADGQGVIGFAACEEDAKAMLGEEEGMEREYGPGSWRTVADCGGYDVEPISEFLRDNPRAQEAYETGGVGGLVDYLNEQL